MGRAPLSSTVLLAPGFIKLSLGKMLGLSALAAAQASALALHVPFRFCRLHNLQPKLSPLRRRGLRASSLDGFASWIRLICRICKFVFDL